MEKAKDGEDAKGENRSSSKSQEVDKTEEGQISDPDENGSSSKSQDSDKAEEGQISDSYDYDEDNEDGTDLDYSEYSENSEHSDSETSQVKSKDTESPESPKETKKSLKRKHESDEEVDKEHVSDNTENNEDKVDPDQASEESTKEGERPFKRRQWRAEKSKDEHGSGETKPELDAKKRIIRNIRECSICLQPFTKPKCLPCIHTFCLKCLEEYGEKYGKQSKDKPANNPGDEMACPECRKVFKIPIDGFEKLPGNFFIEQELEVSKSLLDASEASVVSNCEVCSEAKATMFCVECDQKLCDRCLVTHGKLKGCLTHKVVSLDEMKNSRALIQARPSYCGEHKTDQLRLYCYDCDLAMCLMCAVLDHKSHRCADLHIASKNFIEQLKVRIPTLKRYVEQNEKELKRLAVLRDGEDKVLEQISDAKCKIAERVFALKRVIDSERKKLFSALDDKRNERLKEIKKRQDDTEKQLMVIEDLKRYVEELIDKGSACDISQSASSILARSAELVASQRSFQLQNLSEDRVKFLSARVEDVVSGQMKMIGWISVNDDDSIKVQRSRGELIASRSRAKGEVVKLESELHNFKAVVESYAVEFQAAKQQMLGNDDKAKLVEANRENERFIARLRQCSSESVIMIIGLSDGGTTDKQVCRVRLDRLDDVEKIEEKIDAIPTHMGVETVACTIGDTVYVVGVGREYNQLWKWNSWSGWMKCADIDSNRRGHCVAVVDFMLYVLGGLDYKLASLMLSGILAYNKDRNEWSEAGQLTHAVSHAACVAYKDSIYVFGGRDKEKKELSYVQVYNAAQCDSTLMPNSMPRACSLLRAVLYDSTAILLSSWTCLLYNFESQAWQERVAFKADVIHFGLAIDNDTLFIVGGGMNSVDKDKKVIWTCSEEIKSVYVKDVIEDKSIAWKHHAKLSKPSLIFACSVIDG